MRAALLLVALAACGDDAVFHDAAPPLDGARDGAAVITGGALFVAESPPGPSNEDPATWGGVRVYRVDEDGAAPVEIDGIDRDAVHDPVDVLYRAAGGEVLIANRHGNNAADGTPGSISRFSYDPETQALVATTSITGNGLDGVHQLAISPTSGELFAANVDTGVSRFTFAGDAAVSNGTIAGGPVRGVAVSPDGSRLWLTTNGNTIRQFDLGSGLELAPVTIGTGGGLHWIAIRGDDLYTAALLDDKVYRFAIGADSELTLVEELDAPDPVAVTFSESGLELFVTGHLVSDQVTRFEYDAAGDTWTPGAAPIEIGSSLGGIAMLPIR